MREMTPEGNTIERERRTTVNHAMKNVPARVEYRVPA